ncbi:hypothetical protein [Gardnerella sp. KA00255]|uniref:hypothetical protein n=1 Tax=Gardnerella sp. KA00255 TaxID=2749073 RepID=UPI003BA9125B
MSDFNDGVDDYRGKNQMNGVAGNDASSSVVADNAGYSQNSQAYGQAYCQSAQNHDQPMQQQPQFVSPYGQSVQPQMNPQQMSQQQFGQPRMSQQPPYGQPPIGRSYRGATFAPRAGYVNGRFNPAYIEEQARKFYSTWNAKENISSIIVVVIVAINTFCITSFITGSRGIDFCSNASGMIRDILKYNNLQQVLFEILCYVEYMLAFVIILSFSQILRKRFFTVSGGGFVAVSVFLALFFNFHTFGTIGYDILVYFLKSAAIVIFFAFAEILQWLITKYQPVSNLKYMIVNFISVIIFCIANAIFDICINNWSNFEPSSISSLLLGEAVFFILAILMLVFVTCLLAWSLKVLKLAKFLNPEREMMHL